MTDENFKRLKINPPTLEEIKNNDLSKEQLQAALLQLIEKHNELYLLFKSYENNNRIRSTEEAIMNSHYGL